MEYPPPGLHNKRTERFIREVKEKSNAIRAGLSYGLPKKLVFELYEFKMDTINMVPNTQTVNYSTPFQLMTRKRPSYWCTQVWTSRINVHEAPITR